MKNILLCVTFIISISNSYSQNWLWAKRSIGIGESFSRSVTTDVNGNVFAVGFFDSTITLGSITLNNISPNRSRGDIFIVKYDANGNVLWAKSAGGKKDEWGYSISADLAGNIYIAGSFTSDTINFGSISLINTVGVPPVENSFIAKYDGNGNVLWAKITGGSTYNGSYSVSADAVGNVFLTGEFMNTITFDSFTLTETSGNPDMFLVKYDGNGNVLWAKSAGGPNYDKGYSVSTGPGGNAFVTGSFGGPNISFGSITLTGGGIFIVKYDGNGNVLWAKSVQGNSPAVSSDANGNALLTGGFYNTNLTFGSTTLFNAGGWDVFTAKYDPNGNALWARSEGGTNDDFGYSVSTDAGGNVFVSGSFKSAAIVFGSDTLTRPLGSTDPMFILKFDVNGNELCASALGSGGKDVNGTSVDPVGNAYIGGGYRESSFIVGTDTLPLTSTGYYRVNFFIAKYECVSNNGINELSNEKDISVFPNPSVGMFTINLMNKTIETKICVHDLLGNCLLDKECRNELNPTIDLVGRTNGIYFLEIVSDSKRVVKKIVVE